jgi:hypothetical protein
MSVLPNAFGATVSRAIAEHDARPQIHLDTRCNADSGNAYRDMAILNLSEAPDMMMSHGQQTGFACLCARVSWMRPAEESVRYRPV